LGEKRPKITVCPPVAAPDQSDNQGIVAFRDGFSGTRQAMKDVTFSREIGLSASARADSSLRNALYFAGLKIARYGAVSSIGLFIVSFFGSMGYLVLNGHFLPAALLWVVGGAILPLSLRFFQSPFALAGGALIRLSGKSVYTQLDKIPPRMRG
jgi:hypothetical protein